MSSKSKAQTDGLQSLGSKLKEQVVKRPYLMLVLVAVALLFSIIPPTAAFGALCSIAFLCIVVVFQRDGVAMKQAPLAKALAIAGIAFGLIINSAYAAGLNQAVDSSSLAVATETTEVAANDGELSVKLQVQGKDGLSQPVTIVVEGEDSTGAKVTKDFTITPDQTKQLDFGAGEYTFTYEPEKQVDPAILCKAKSHTVEFSGAEDKIIAFILTYDEGATTKLQEEKAAAEAAEKQKQEEEAARLAAQQEEERCQTEAAAAQAQAPTEATVYVASSGKGKKYHSNPNCSGMKGARSLTVSEAESIGYTPCSKCY